MMFIVISRILGVYPFGKSGKLNIFKYVFYLIQLFVIFWYDWFPATRHNFQELTRHNMLSTSIAVGSRSVYFLTPFIHAVYLIRFKSKFESITMFLEEGKDSWVSTYVSHIGLIAAVLTTYCLVEWSMLLTRVVQFPEEDGHMGEFMMHHMYLLDFLIMAQYSTFANKVSIEYAKSGELLKKYWLFQALNKQNSIMDNLRNMNAIYGPQLLIRIMQAFITLLGYSFAVLTKTSTLYSESVLEKCGQVLIFIMILGELFCVCGVCSQASDQAQAFNLELFKVMQENQELCANKKLRLYLAMKQPINFTACGFFSLGYPLVTTIMGAATTYLVILIQLTV